MHVWMCTQETLEGKRERNTFNQKRFRKSRKRQHILGFFDVKQSWDHPTNVRLLNIQSFRCVNSFCQPCHIIHVYSLTTRQNPRLIHWVQSNTWANVSNLWQQSEDILHRQKKIQKKVVRMMCQIITRQSAISELERIFTNRIAKAAIKQLTEKSRTMLIHVKNRWPEVIQPWLWPFALKQVEFNLNNLRLGKSGKLGAKTFSDMHNKINIRHYHTFCCPVYVLNARLQGASFIPKWDEQGRVGAYVGRSFPHIKSLYGTRQSKISRHVRRNLFNCSITKKRISSSFLIVHLRK